MFRKHITWASIANFFKRINPWRPIDSIKPYRTFNVQGGTLIAFSDDEKKITTVSSDAYPYYKTITMQQIDVETTDILSSYEKHSDYGKEIKQKFENRETPTLYLLPRPMCLSGDGTTVIINNQFYDAATGKNIATFDQDAFPLCISHDGVKAIFATSLKSSEFVRSGSGSSAEGNSDGIFYADTHQVVVYDRENNKTITLSHPENSKSFFDTTDTTRTMTFSGDGTKFACIMSGQWQKNIKMMMLSGLIPFLT